MRVAWIVAVLVCLVVLATGAFAQDASARSAAMGGAGKEADQEGATQWLRNPAGLAQTGDPLLWATLLAAQTKREWINSALWGWDDCDEDWGLDWSGWNLRQGYGVGVGYAHGGGTDEFGLGAGLKLGSGFSVGLNGRHEAGFGNSMTTYTGGLQWQDQSVIPNLRVGLLARDLTNQSNDLGVWDFGVSYKPIKNLLIDADIRDVTNKFNSMFDIGGEYKFGSSGQYAVRAGLHDYGTFTGWTGGVGYRISPCWGVDAATIDADDCWKADFYYYW